MFLLLGTNTTPGQNTLQLGKVLLASGKNNQADQCLKEIFKMCRIDVGSGWLEKCSTYLALASSSSFALCA